MRHGDTGRILRNALAAEAGRSPWAVHGLAVRGARLDVLRAQLGSDDPAVQAVAALALGDVEDLSAVPELRRRLPGAEEPFFSAAIQTLVRLAGTSEARDLAPLVRGRGFRATAGILTGLPADEALVVHRLVDALDARERLRAIRLLVAIDHPAVRGLPMSSEAIGRLYPYLVRSSFSRVRRRVTRAPMGARAAALAAHMLSGVPSASEKREVAAEMFDVWAEAGVLGGSEFLAVLEEVLSDAELYAEGTWWKKAPLEASNARLLAMLPGSEARRALESMGTAEAVDALRSRSDRALAVPAFLRLARSGDERLRLSAEKGILELGAPGATAIVRRRLPTPERLRPLLPSLSRALLPPRLVQQAIEGVA